MDVYMEMKTGRHSATRRPGRTRAVVVGRPIQQTVPREQQERVDSLQNIITKIIYVIFPAFF
jgi:hypothetical protein